MRKTRFRKCRNLVEMLLGCEKPAGAANADFFCMDTGWRACPLLKHAEKNAKDKTNPEGVFLRISELRYKQACTNITSKTKSHIYNQKNAVTESPPLHQNILAMYSYCNGFRAQKHFLMLWLVSTEFRNWFKLDDDGEGPRALHEKRLEATQKK